MVLKLQRKVTVRGLVSCKTKYATGATVNTVHHKQFAELLFKYGLHGSLFGMYPVGYNSYTKRFQHHYNISIFINHFRFFGHGYTIIIMDCKLTGS